MNYKEFIKNYWNYYLELEDDLLQIQKYVNFDKKNWKIFSNEFIKLLEIIGSEVDTIAKELVVFNNTALKIKQLDNIHKWGYEIQNIIQNIEYKKLQFNNESTISPWKNWKYEKKDDGKIKLLPKKETPKWWTAYNKVKHTRTAKTKEGYNYERANLENVINALGGLFIIEQHFFELLPKDETLSFRHSKLFREVVDDVN